VSNSICFGILLLEAQNERICKKLGGIAPLGPLATPNSEKTLKKKFKKHFEEDVFITSRRGKHQLFVSKTQGLRFSITHRMSKDYKTQQQNIWGS